jgi:hypothetical protein
MTGITNTGTQFPFDCFSESDWEERVLTQLKEASRENGVTGVFLLVASPQGHIFQHLAVCQGDSRAEGAVWSTVTNKSEVWPINFVHDPAQFLVLLAELSPDRHVNNLLKRDPARGREATLFIVSCGQGGWLRCQTPLLDALKYDRFDRLILDLQGMPNERQPV